MQRALLQYFKPQNKELVLEALKKAGRYDLIGKSPKCLVDEDKKTENKPFMKNSKNSAKKSGGKAWQGQNKKTQRKIKK